MRKIMSKQIAAIVSLCLLLAMFFSAYKYIDSRYALAEEMKKVEQRLDYKIKSDQRFEIQKEMRAISEANLGKPIEKWPERDRNRYLDLKEQLEDIQDQLKVLQKK